MVGALGRRNLALSARQAAVRRQHAPGTVAPDPVRVADDACDAAGRRGIRLRLWHLIRDAIRGGDDALHGAARGRDGMAIVVCPHLPGERVVSTGARPSQQGAEGYGHRLPDGPEGCGNRCAAIDNDYVDDGGAAQLVQRVEQRPERDSQGILDSESQHNGGEGEEPRELVPELRGWRHWAAIDFVFPALASFKRMVRRMVQMALE